MIGSELYDFKFFGGIEWKWIKKYEKKNILMKSRLLNDWLVEKKIISWGVIKVQLWRNINYNDWMYLLNKWSKYFISTAGLMDFGIFEQNSICLWHFHVNKM